jgi:hypothetical protein
MVGENVESIPEQRVAWKAFAAAGLLAACKEESFGGMRLPYVVERAGLAFVLAACPTTSAYAFLTMANANLLLTHGTPSQIDRFVHDQLTVIILTNLAEASPARVSRAIAGTLIPAVAAPVYKPIADEEPAVTARFFDVLRRTREGGLRADEFTEPVWAYIAPRSEQLRRDFGSFGAIQKLTLVERTENGSDRSYRYQARLSRTTMIFHFVLTKEGRISVMMPEAVNQ